MRISIFIQSDDFDFFTRIKWILLPYFVHWWFLFILKQNKNAKYKISFPHFILYSIFFLFDKNISKYRMEREREIGNFLIFISLFSLCVHHFLIFFSLLFPTPHFFDVWCLSLIFFFISISILSLSIYLFLFFLSLLLTNSMSFSYIYIISFTYKTHV